MTSSLLNFVHESNRIEGIEREPTKAEIDAHAALLSERHLSLANIEAFVGVVAPDKPIRSTAGMNVRVGSHVAPPGGPSIATELRNLLTEINERRLTPYHAHCRYETLHPFMDGNGRSGRAIWLWMMGGRAPLGFLHHFYYQTLEACDQRLRSPESESGDD